MQVIVSGKHLNIGDSLREHAANELKKSVVKYFDHAIDAHVTISKDKQIYKTDIILNEGTGTGVIIKSSAQEYDPYKSFDDSLSKVEKQLRRYKRRIKNHKKAKIDPLNLVSSKKYVISPFEDEDEIEEGDAPAIIAEKTHAIEHLSVADAVMKMDLLDLPALLFINTKNKKISLVYYRKDGNISWVDTAISI